MASHDIDRLIEQSFSGDPPDSAFRARVLKESIEALDRGRRAHVWRRLAQFGLAATFIAGASFLAGRLTATGTATSDANPTPRATIASGGVTVPDELLAWLEAANLFRQVGMPDRMARAVDRAGRLLPDDGKAVPVETDAVLADHRPSAERKKKPLDWVARSNAVASGECLNRIIAQTLGE